MSNQEPSNIWAQVLRELSGSMSGSSFSTWVKPLKLQSIEEVGDDRAICKISADSPYVAQQAEMRCYAQIKQIIDRETGRKCDLSFSSQQENKESPTTADNLDKTINSQPESQPNNIDQAQQKVATATQMNNSPLLADHRLNQSADQNQPHNKSNNRQSSTPNRSRSNKTKQDTPSLFSQAEIRMPTVDRYKLAAQKAHLREDFTFESYAVSGSNEMAYSAAQAVTTSLGQVYNPMFIWGGVGVGKTHLMQAIGNSVLRNNPDIKLSYIMGEEFLNEIIAAIRTHKTIDFKARYRSLKVLLIDDIQFIAGKDTAQEEFFHTFNAIARAGGQIIMTSDRPPHEINPLEDRLRSRFEGGLIIDIQQPTFELRTAILLIKSQKLGLELPMNLAQIIASEVESTRKLEGVIFKLHSAYNFQNKNLDEDLIRQILGSESKPVIARKRLKPSAILRAVTSHFHVSASTLRGPSRKKDYVTARHIAMFLMKQELDVPYSEIGRSFGGRDHTSVMHAVNKIEEKMADSDIINQHVTAIRSSLSSL